MDDDESRGAKPACEAALPLERPVPVVCFHRSAGAPKLGDQFENVRPASNVLEGKENVHRRRRGGHSLVFERNECALDACAKPDRWSRLAADRLQKSVVSTT